MGRREPTHSVGVEWCASRTHGSMGRLKPGVRWPQVSLLTRVGYDLYTADY